MSIAKRVELKKEKDSAEKSKISCHAILSQMNNFKEYCFIIVLLDLCVENSYRLQNIESFII